MNRRAFLTALFGTAAAAALLPSIDALAIDAAPAEVEAIRWTHAYDAVLREAEKLFRSAMAGNGLDRLDVAPYAAKVGTVLPNGLMIRHQFNVSAERFAELSEDMPRIDAAMRALANHTSRYGVDSFAQLQTKIPGVYAVMGGPLRMIVQYQIETDTFATRFDVIGAASAYGQRIVRANKARILKVHIRQRLAHRVNYVPLPIPA